MPSLWATKFVGISPSRILNSSQSLGTAVSLAISAHFALQIWPVVFAGTNLVAPFVDVATYRVAGFIPILSPLARFPLLFTYLSTFKQDKWLSKDRIAEYIRVNEANGEKYKLTLIHAEDDYDIPSHYTEVFFWHAVNATVPRELTYGELEEIKYNSERNMGAVGSMTEWRDQLRRHHRGDRPTQCRDGLPHNHHCCHA